MAIVKLVELKDVDRLIHSYIEDEYRFKGGTYTGVLSAEEMYMVDKLTELLKDLESLHTVDAKVEYKFK